MHIVAACSIRELPTCLASTNYSKLLAGRHAPPHDTKLLDAMIAYLQPHAAVLDTQLSDTAGSTASDSTAVLLRPSWLALLAPRLHPLQKHVMASAPSSSEDLLQSF